MTTTAAWRLNNGVCPTTGTFRYFSRAKAKKAARTFHPETAMRAYSCGDHWHYGVTPEWARRGQNVTPADAPAPTSGEGPRRSYTVTLPPGLTLINANHSMHYQKKAKLTRSLREAATAACNTNELLRAAIVAAAGLPVLRHAHIIGVYHPARGGRVDPANLYPSFKAAVDGIVDARVLEDDDATRVLGPDMRLGPVVTGGQIVLHIHEAYPELDGWLGETEAAS